LGARAGDRVAVLSGVEAGEMVVVSANFLIDAESNLRSAMQGMEHGSTPPAEDHSAHDASAEPTAPPVDDPHAAHSGGQ
jgi:Cu(I)/Ag(I) efflux system membrane fusion protein